MTKSHKRKPQGQRLSNEDQEWIERNVETGKFEDIPWVAVPNRPGREPFSTEEIVEVLNVQHKED